MTYAEKLKDPRWQKKRLEIMQRDDFKCCECSSADKTLHVHHLRYIDGKNPWEYENNDLLTLCHNCHSIYHSPIIIIDNGCIPVYSLFKINGVRYTCFKYFDLIENHEGMWRFETRKQLSEYTPVQVYKIIDALSKIKSFIDWCDPGYITLNGDNIYEELPFSDKVESSYLGSYESEVENNGDLYNIKEGKCNCLYVDHSFLFEGDEYCRKCNKKTSKTREVIP